MHCTVSTSPSCSITLFFFPTSPIPALSKTVLFLFYLICTHIPTWLSVSIRDVELQRRESMAYLWNRLNFPNMILSSYILLFLGANNMPSTFMALWKHALYFTVFMGFSLKSWKQHQHCIFQETSQRCNCWPSTFPWFINLEPGEMKKMPGTTRKQDPNSLSCFSVSGIMNLHS